MTFVQAHPRRGSYSPGDICVSGEVSGGVSGHPSVGGVSGHPSMCGVAGKRHLRGCPESSRDRSDAHVMTAPTSAKKHPLQHSLVQRHTWIRAHDTRATHEDSSGHARGDSAETNSGTMLDTHADGGPSPQRHTSMAVQKRPQKRPRNGPPERVGKRVFRTGHDSDWSRWESRDSLSRDSRVQRQSGAAAQSWVSRNTAVVVGVHQNSPAAVTRAAG
jgi:hypothetical protein